jgi:D-cysteine desulfhydrase family pyridoxal phosphate-dependent enzyme
MSDPSTEIPELANFARVRLGHAPTPIDAAPSLGKELGITLRVKRDDCTGLAFGGNKVRQLEFYLGEALAQNADTVLITGAVQSNFVRTTAAAARQLGMQVHVQLEERVANMGVAYQTSGNVLLNRILGAHIHRFPVGEDEAAADAALEQIADSLKAQGHRPYVIHLGIEHAPIGALGYVVAAAEIVAQMRNQALAFDAIVVPSGSGLTHAGLLVGLRALGVGTPVYGVCVRRDADLQEPRVARRAREVEALVDSPGLLEDGDIRVTDRVLAPGYGKLNGLTFAAMDLAALREGLLLDPVYTGKTMAGLMSLLEAGEIGAGQRVLFVHTGGQPALFGYQSTLDGHVLPTK